MAISARCRRWHKIMEMIGRPSLICAGNKNWRNKRMGREDQIRGTRRKNSHLINCRCLFFCFWAPAATVDAPSGLRSKISGMWHLPTTCVTVARRSPFHAAHSIQIYSKQKSPQNDGQHFIYIIFSAASSHPIPQHIFALDTFYVDASAPADIWLFRLSSWTICASFDHSG